MTEKCFKKCVTKPGTSLDSSEQVHDFNGVKPNLQNFRTRKCWHAANMYIISLLLQKCVAMCMDRYMDAFNVVSKAYSDRLQRERNRM